MLGREVAFATVEDFVQGYTSLAAFGDSIGYKGDLVGLGVVEALDSIDVHTFKPCLNIAQTLNNLDVVLVQSFFFQGLVNG